MSKFRWRPLLAVTLAYLGSAIILTLCIVFDLPWWVQIPITAVAICLLAALAEDNPGD